MTQLVLPHFPHLAALPVYILPSDTRPPESMSRDMRQFNVVVLGGEYIRYSVRRQQL